MCSAKNIHRRMCSAKNIVRQDIAENFIKYFVSLATKLDAGTESWDYDNFVFSIATFTDVDEQVFSE